MKSIKRFSLMMAAVFTLGGVAMAGEARGGKREMDPKARAEKMTERMVKEYKLDDSQKQQVLDLNMSMADKMGDRAMMHRHHGKKGKPGQMDKAKRGDKDAVKGKERAERKNRADAPKPSAEEREKRMQEMKQSRDNYNAELQKIMNNEQYQAYAKKQAERDQKRQERSGKMKENRSKRGAQKV